MYNFENFQKILLVIFNHNKMFYYTWIYIKFVCWILQQSNSLKAMLKNAICPVDWREISMKQFVGKCKQINF